MDKILVIMNPAARGEKAARLYEKIAAIAGPVEILRTEYAGQAREFAAQAVRDGYTTVVAAGGDGTINEVVNGLAGSPVRLGVLPIGTMNVLAAELALPARDLARCWEIICHGEEREIDLPMANQQFFVQLAGVGLDAQVVEETDLGFRKNFGPLSYLVSLSQIAARTPPELIIESEDGSTRQGCFVLIGNGRFYGGPFSVFDRASLQDGLLDVLVFRGIGHLDIVRYVQTIFFGKLSELSDVDYFQTPSLRVNSAERVPVEVDGEVTFDLPVHFHISPRSLRIMAARDTALSGG